MVRFKTLSRDEAKRIISAFDNYDDVEFDDLVNHWKHYDPVSEYDESFVDFRNELLAAFREGLQETNGKMDYPVDLKVGLKIYSLLPIGKNFSIVQANNDDFWRYISVKVMPDITYLRSTRYVNANREDDLPPFSQEEKVLEYAKENDSFSNKDIVELLQITVGSGNVLLSTMVKKGLLIRVKRGWYSAKV